MSGLLTHVSIRDLELIFRFRHDVDAVEIRKFVRAALDTVADSIKTTRHVRFKWQVTDLTHNKEDPTTVPANLAMPVF